MEWNFADSQIDALCNCEPKLSSQSLVTAPLSAPSCQEECCFNRFLTARYGRETLGAKRAAPGFRKARLNV